MRSLRPIELLSPAKDLECGWEAVNHGADAVYIGAPKFGARASAGNSVEDIRRLCEYAHLFDVKVYVALNTILKDSELKEAERIVKDVYRAGADALIIQDMGLLNLDLPPIALHASTQCDNREVEKVKFFEEAGFSQVVLARELSLDEMKEIASRTNVALEVFVHGALCVSYSGQCYISQALSGRSANRGDCAQYCRLPYTLMDADGKVIADKKHLLSLKDLDRSEDLEALLEAGISSLKIEGRLKDLSYVKNVTAYYRRKLDEIFKRKPSFARSSCGRSEYTFTPDLEKSFNRGFTKYFFSGRSADMASYETPKFKGEPVGRVRDVGGNYLSLSGSKSIHNGDGLCFVNENSVLEGFRVNRAEGMRIFPAEMPRIKPGVSLFRNYDSEFEKKLLKKSAERRIALDFTLKENNFGFTLEARDEEGVRAGVTIAFGKEEAKNKESNEKNILSQLDRLGDTIFKSGNKKKIFRKEWFIPASVMGEMRRKAVEALMSARRIAYVRTDRKIEGSFPPFPLKKLTYLGNVYNSKALDFYKEHGVESVSPAFEDKAEGKTLMFCRYCILYNIGKCKKKEGRVYKEPLYLLCGDKKLQLEFDCRDCLMKVNSL